MFTGIVETSGEIVSIVHREGGARLVVRVGAMAGELTMGESVAVNGCCLTVTEFDAAAQTAAFDLLIETLRVTNLGDQRKGSVVNLERSLRVGDRLSGHFVQGHVDATAKIIALESVGMDHRFAVELPKEWAHLVVHKGSLCVNGISLTVAEVGEAQAEFWIIPHTYTETNLRTLKAGDRVNLEFDMLAKHVAVMMEHMKK
jgi:riboflavin synthase